MELHSDYLYGLGHPRILKRYIDACEKRLVQQKLLDKFHTIIYTGISGSLIAIPLAQRLGKTLCAVRKEKSHSPFLLEGILGKNSLILDDFPDSFTTMKKMWEAKSKRTNINYILFYGTRSKTFMINQCKKKFGKRPIFLERRFFNSIDNQWIKIQEKEKIRYNKPPIFQSAS